MTISIEKLIYVVNMLHDLNRNPNRDNFWCEWKAATRGVLWKKMFLEISQNSQESTCALWVSFLIKLQAWGFCKFCETSKNTFLQNTFKRLLLTCADVHLPNTLQKVRMKNSILWKKSTQVLKMRSMFFK